jgi:hypothetical protein
MGVLSRIVLSSKHVRHPVVRVGIFILVASWGFCSRHYASPAAFALECRSIVSIVVSPPVVISITYSRVGDLYEGGTAGLNGLDLGSTESGTAEAGRELRDVESNAVGGVDRAEAGA